MLMELGQTVHTLKEWAIAIQALEAGKTIMLLRKGGIREQQGRFQVTHPQVLLYPTFEHQQPLLLKAEYTHLVQPVASGWHPETVRIGSWAEITDIFPVMDELIVSRLLPFHIWNEHFISDRLKWKSQQPLFILLLRTFKLAQVWEIPYRLEYGGCKSWINITQPIDLQGSEPALSDLDYQHLRTEIRTIIANKTD
ncbi:DUF1802 family protein [Nostoc sp. CMAA1605]|uniref:DUF1802 family protein n=1 Tax=Nostoc sp. CMAA1605 TaxID=2055159 RepID=UPI001F2FBAD7|nr:DUF1802 family protein [Nostoc sp. CMAA1605]MCF4965866.1 hypothetical protein [Nostoc sp. CMAA1605]